MRAIKALEREKGVEGRGEESKTGYPTLPYPTLRKSPKRGEGHINTQIEKGQSEQCTNAHLHLHLHFSCCCCCLRKERGEDVAGYLIKELVQELGGGGAEVRN